MSYNTLRKSETAATQQRLLDTDRRLDDLWQRIHSGIGNLPPREWDQLISAYNSALRRKEIDEQYLKQLVSKDKMTDEERGRTNKKDYKRNYKY